MVVGHRGAPRLAPENSLDGFLAAVTAGAGWVELDARRGADGTVVVVHDALLPDGAPVVELTGPDLLARGVPTLAQVLALLPDGIGVDVELKNLYGEPDYDEQQRLADLVAGVLAPAVGQRPLIASSFNPLALGAVRAALPGVALGLLTVPGLSVAAGLDLASEFGTDALHPHRSAPDLDSGAVGEARARGLPLMVWTVDEPDEARRLARAGVDAICTNDPEGVAKALAG